MATFYVSVNHLLKVGIYFGQIMAKSMVNVNYISPRETTQHKVQRNDTRIERVSRGSRFHTQHRNKVVPDEMMLANFAIAFNSKQ